MQQTLEVCQDLRSREFTMYMLRTYSRESSRTPPGRVPCARLEHVLQFENKCPGVCASHVNSHDCDHQIFPNRETGRHWLIRRDERYQFTRHSILSVKHASAFSVHLLLIARCKRMYASSPSLLAPLVASEITLRQSIQR